MTNYIRGKDEKDFHEWNLGDEEVKLDMCDCDKECYWPEDVREFIRKLREKGNEIICFVPHISNINDHAKGHIIDKLRWFMDEIETLAGPKLVALKQAEGDDVSVPQKAVQNALKVDKKEGK